MLDNSLISENIMGGLVSFLVCCIVLIVVLYIFQQVLGMIELPAPVKNIAWLIVGLIALLVLINITLHAFGGGGFVAF